MTARIVSITTRYGGDVTPSLRLPRFDDKPPRPAKRLPTMTPDEPAEGLNVPQTGLFECMTWVDWLYLGGIFACIIAVIGLALVLSSPVQSGRVYASYAPAAVERHVEWYEELHARRVCRDCEVAAKWESK